MLDSYEDAFGHGLIDGLDRGKASPEEQASVVAGWSCGLVSHDFLRDAEDPIFIYGTRASDMKSNIGSGYRNKLDSHVGGEVYRSIGQKFRLLVVSSVLPCSFRTLVRVKADGSPNPDLIQCSLFPNSGRP